MLLKRFVTDDKTVRHRDAEADQLRQISRLATVPFRLRRQTQLNQAASACVVVHVVRSQAITHAARAFTLNK